MKPRTVVVTFEWETDATATQIKQWVRDEFINATQIAVNVIRATKPKPKKKGRR